MAYSGRLSPREQARFQRLLMWSFAVHVGGFGLALVVPPEWLGLLRQPPEFMSVSLGGQVGPVTTGITPVGGRTVERVVPPPPKPEPIKPTPPPPPKPSVATVKPKPELTPPPVAAPNPAATTKPTPPPTGAQVSQGNTRVETGATGQGTGLTSAGGGGLNAELADDFCCKEWLSSVLQLIDREWAKTLPGRGTTVMMFTVTRDGTLVDIKVATPSGDATLDLEARRALMTVARVPRLPQAYSEETLTIRLRFPYGGR